MSGDLNYLEYENQFFINKLNDFRSILFVYLNKEVNKTCICLLNQEYENALIFLT